MSNRDDEYFEDPLDRELREERDRMDFNDEIQRMLDETSQGEEADFEADLAFWNDDLADSLKNIGYSSTEISLFDQPKDRLMRIYKRYERGSFSYDDYGNETVNDPLPSYYFEGTDEKKGLYDLGYKLGYGGELGGYYKLLPLIDFSRGYWLGLFRKGMEEKNSNIVQEVSREIEIFDPSIVKEEISKIVSSSYYPSDEKKNINK